MQRNGSVTQPYSNQVKSTWPERQGEDQLLDIANDGSLKCIFHSTTLPMFWMKVLARIPWPWQKALKTSLPFLTSYLWESGFSVMAAIKTKARNRLDVRDTFPMSLSSIIPRWERLVAAKQAQGSHWIKVVITYLSCIKYSLLNICVSFRPVREIISVFNRSAVQKGCRPLLQNTNIDISFSSIIIYFALQDKTCSLYFRKASIIA